MLPVDIPHPTLALKDTTVAPKKFVFISGDIPVQLDI